MLLAASLITTWLGFRSFRCSDLDWRWLGGVSTRGRIAGPWNGLRDTSGKSDQRWGDQPHMLLDLVKGYLHSPSLRPRIRNQEQAERRQAMQEELLGRLRGPVGPLRRTLLRTLFRYNEIYMGVRDEHRFHFDRNWYALRWIYRSYGRRLAEVDVIACFWHGTR